MLRRGRKLLPLLLMLAALLAVAPAAAQERALHWERYDVTVQIERDGDLRFEEAQTIEFDQGTFRSGTRSFPLREGERVRDVSVSEDGERYDQGADTPGTFEVTEEDGSFAVRYWFADSSESTHEMLISYTVSGALEERDQRLAGLDWDLYGDNPFPIQRGELRVELPGSPNDMQLSFHNAGSGTGGRLDGSAVVFSVERLPANAKPLRARISFPRELLSSNVKLRPVDVVAPTTRPRVNDQPVQRAPVDEAAGVGVDFMVIICCVVMLLVLFLVILPALRRMRTAGPGYQQQRRRGGWGGGWWLPPGGSGDSGGGSRRERDQGGGSSSGDWGGGSGSSGGFSSGDWGGGSGGVSLGDWGSSSSGGSSSGDWGGSSSSDSGSSSSDSGSSSSDSGGGGSNSFD